MTDVNHSPGQDMHFMAMALSAARAAGEAGEVPVGAVMIAADGTTVLATARNAPLTDHDATAHAEIAAIRAAGQALGNYRLDGCTLYVTLEPCTMCVGALVHARVARVVFAADEPKAGSLRSARQLMEPALGGWFNHRFAWQGGILAEESKGLLQAFFRSRRAAVGTSGSHDRVEN